jgi:RNA polymerase sigma factor (sigma-70 family)
MSGAMREGASSVGQRNRELFHASIARHLPRLYHFVRHRLAYAQAVGDVLPGELEVDDVVDAVVERAHAELVGAPLSARKLARRLVGIAREQLEREVKRLKAWRERTPVRTEDDVPETPPAEAVSRMGEEILEFYEPDEDLKVEDILPDLEVPTPEEVTASGEVQACVDAALAAMPRQWRRAMLMRYVEGLRGAELATAMAMPPGDVERVLDHARQYLRRKLVESGCAREEIRP